MFFIITQFARLYVEFDILLTCGKYFHDGMTNKQTNLSTKYYRKLKIEQLESHYKSGVTSGPPEG